MLRFRLGPSLRKHGPGISSSTHFLKRPGAGSSSPRQQTSQLRNPIHTRITTRLSRPQADQSPLNALRLVLFIQTRALTTSTPRADAVDPTKVPRRPGRSKKSSLGTEVLYEEKELELGGGVGPKGGGLRLGVRIYRPMDARLPPADAPIPNNTTIPLTIFFPSGLPVYIPSTVAGSLATSTSAPSPFSSPSPAGDSPSSQHNLLLTASDHDLATVLCLTSNQTVVVPSYFPTSSHIIRQLFGRFGPGPGAETWKDIKNWEWPEEEYTPWDKRDPISFSGASSAGEITIKTNWAYPYPKHPLATHNALSAYTTIIENLPSLLNLHPSVPAVTNIALNLSGSVLGAGIAAALALTEFKHPPFQTAVKFPLNNKLTLDEIFSSMPSEAISVSAGEALATTAALRKAQEAAAALDEEDREKGKKQPKRRKVEQKLKQALHRAQEQQKKAEPPCMSVELHSLALISPMVNWCFPPLGGCDFSGEARGTGQTWLLPPVPPLPEKPVEELKPYEIEGGPHLIPTLTLPTLLRLRQAYFSSPEDYIDPFASPLFFLQTPGVDVGNDALAKLWVSLKRNAMTLKAELRRARKVEDSWGDEQVKSPAEKRAWGEKIDILTMDGTRRKSVGRRWPPVWSVLQVRGEVDTRRGGIPKKGRVMVIVPGGGRKGLSGEAVWGDMELKEMLEPMERPMTIVEQTVQQLKKKEAEQKEEDPTKWTPPHLDAKLRRWGTRTAANATTAPAPTPVPVPQAAQAQPQPTGLTIVMPINVANVVQRQPVNIGSMDRYWPTESTSPRLSFESTPASPPTPTPATPPLPEKHTHTAPTTIISEASEYSFDLTTAEHYVHSPSIISGLLDPYIALARLTSTKHPLGPKRPAGWWIVRCAAEFVDGVSRAWRSVVGMDRELRGKLEKEREEREKMRKMKQMTTRSFLWTGRREHEEALVEVAEEREEPEEEEISMEGMLIVVGEDDEDPWEGWDERFEDWQGEDAEEVVPEDEDPQEKRKKAKKHMDAVFKLGLWVKKMQKLD